MDTAATKQGENKMATKISKMADFVVVNDMSNIDGWKKIISSHRTFANAEEGAKRAQPREKGSYLPTTILYRPEIETQWARPSDKQQKLSDGEVW
jgi:hypothetical protein